MEDLGCVKAFRINGTQWKNIVDRSGCDRSRKTEFTKITKKPSTSCLLLEKVKQLKELKNKKYENPKFYELRKEQVKVREQLLKDSRVKTNIKIGDDKLDVDRSLQMSEVLYERQKMEEVKYRMRKLEEKEKLQEMANLREVVQEEMQREIKEAEMRKKLKENFKNDCLKQIKEREKQEEFERKQKQEGVEIYKQINKEMKDIETTKTNQKIKEKRKLLNQFKRMLLEEEQKRKQIRQKSREQDLVNAIYADAKHEMNESIKKREKEIQMELFKRQEEARKIIAECLKTDRKLSSRKNEIQETNFFPFSKTTQVKVPSGQEILKKSVAKMKEMEKINAVENNYQTKKYETENIKKYKVKTDEYRKGLNKQIEEKNKVKIEEKNMERQKRIENILKIGEDVSDFLKYAETSAKFCEHHGRTAIPIKNAVKDFVNKNKMLLLQVREI